MFVCGGLNESGLTGVSNFALVSSWRDGTVGGVRVLSWLVRWIIVALERFEPDREEALYCQSQ